MLSKLRQQQLVSGLNGTATKVWDAVPANEAWTRKQIADELRRRNIGVDAASVDGCMTQLVSIALVKRIGELYQRAPLRKEPEAVMPSDTPQPIETKSREPAGSASGELDRLGAQMRMAATEAFKLAARFQELADEAENVAVALLDVELSAAEKAELNELRLFRSTMKRMMGQ
jgi:hypothetical protein